MPLDQVANFIRGATDAATDSTQTTISVVDASIFPDPASEEYNLVFWNDTDHPRPDQDPSVEVVRVTGRDTTNDDLTVTRGQESTSGSSHESGSALQLSPTAKMFTDIESELAASANTPNWQEDANSPVTGTGSQSYTITLDGTYDLIMVLFENFENTSGSSQQMGLRFDGDTGTNYDVITADGTTTTGLTFAPFSTLALSSFGSPMVATFQGRWGSNLEGEWDNTPAFANEVASFRNYGTTSPLDSITFRGDSGTIAVKARVFGWNGGL